MYIYVNESLHKHLSYIISFIVPEDMIQSLNQEVKMSARFWPRIQQFIRNR